jgi:hypothetical protein
MQETGLDCWMDAVAYHLLITATNVCACLQVLLAASVHVVMLFMGAAVARGASDILFLVSSSFSYYQLHNTWQALYRHSGTS